MMKTSSLTAEDGYGGWLHVVSGEVHQRGLRRDVVRSAHDAGHLDAVTASWVDTVSVLVHQPQVAAAGVGVGRRQDGEVVLLRR